MHQTQLVQEGGGSSWVSKCLSSLLKLSANRVVVILVGRASQMVATLDEKEY